MKMLELQKEAVEGKESKSEKENHQANRWF
jgi:hypothetical protein